MAYSLKPASNQFDETDSGKISLVLIGTAIAFETIVLEQRPTGGRDNATRNGCRTVIF